MPQYMLALYDDPSHWPKFSPEEMQKILEKYMAWGKRPYVVDGKRLAGDNGRVLKAAGGKARATDGPYSETKEVLGGIYLIEAKDYDEAVERTLDHPHLDHGTIEVRQLYS
jgi:hypothetical protein